MAADDNRTAWTERFIRVLAVSIAVLVLPTTAQSQSTCRAFDSLSTSIVAEILRYTTATTSSPDAYNVRLALDIPNTSSVSLVTSSQVCGKARTAFVNEFAANGAVSAQLYVFAVGNAYAIVDPGYKYDGVDRGGRYAPVYFVDSHYKKLGILA